MTSQPAAPSSHTPETQRPNAPSNTSHTLLEQVPPWNGWWLCGVVLLGLGVGYGSYETWKLPPWHHETMAAYRVAAALANGLCAALSPLFFALLAPFSFSQQKQSSRRTLTFFQGLLWLWWIAVWAGLGLPIFGWSGLFSWIACVLLLLAAHSDEFSWTELAQRALPWLLVGSMVLNFAQPLVAWLWLLSPWICLALALLASLRWPWRESRSNALFALSVLLFGLGPWFAYEQRYTSILRLPHLEQMQAQTAHLVLSVLAKERQLSPSSAQKFLQGFLGRKDSQAQATQIIFQRWASQTKAQPLPYTLLAHVTWDAPNEEALRKALEQRPQHQMILLKQALQGLEHTYKAPLALRLLQHLIAHFPQHKERINTSILQRYFSTHPKDLQKRVYLAQLLKALHGTGLGVALYTYFFKHYQQQSRDVQSRWIDELLAAQGPEKALLRTRFAKQLNPLLHQLLRSRQPSNKRDALRLLSHLGDNEADWLSTFMQTFPPHFLESFLHHKDSSLRAIATTLRFQQWASYPLRVQQLSLALRDPSLNVQLAVLRAFPEIDQQLKQIAPNETFAPTLQQQLYHVCLKALSKDPELIKEIAYTIPRLTLSTSQKAKAFSAAKTLLPIHKPRSARFLRYLFTLLATLEPVSIAPTSSPLSSKTKPQRPMSPPSKQPQTRQRAKKSYPTSQPSSPRAASQRTTSRPTPLFH